MQIGKQPLVITTPLKHLTFFIRSLNKCKDTSVLLQNEMQKEASHLQLDFPNIASLEQGLVIAWRIALFSGLLLKYSCF